MPDIDRLLALAKNTARQAFDALSAVDVESTNAQFSVDMPKELKSTADYKVEKIEEAVQWAKQPMEKATL